MKCEKCGGKGYIEIEETCKVCGGTGKAKSFDPKITAELTKEQLELFMKGICGVCKGTGKVKRLIVCPECKGSGKAGRCKICGAKVIGNHDLCPNCRRKPHAYLLKNSCGIEDVRLNRVYVGKVSAITDIGAFVNLNKRLRGLIHKRNLGNVDLKEDDTVLVKVTNIRPTGEIDLVLERMDNYAVVEVSKEVPTVKIAELEKHLGKMVEIRGKVTHVKLTGGPTVFTIIDETGGVNAVAFEGGERAYPEIDVDDIVAVVGIVKRREKIQIEVLEMEKLLGEEAYKIQKAIQEELDRRSEPIFTGFLIESEVLERLKPEMMAVAKELRKAVFESRPIIIRHHWDADGVCGGVALEKALIDLVEKYHPDPEAKYYLIRRRVSRAPFYELEDVVKDLDEALEDIDRHGDKVPLVVLVDNGSGLEDVPAIRQFLVFGADVITIDHHFPDEEVDRYLLYHVNPYKVGGDSNYTAGILSVEIARMVNPDVDLKLLAGVSVVGDRAEGEVEKYVELTGLTREELQDIALAIEFEGFYLRFRPSSYIMHEILGFGRKDRQKKLVEMLSSYAKEAIEAQVKTAMEGVKVQELPNGVVLAALDVENYAKKFTFPPPGKLTGEVHDRLKQKYERIVTIGYGPDFAVIRSEGVELDIPRLVRELQEEVNAGVEGGGHLVVGSIKFIPAKRKEVLARLASKIGSI
ncbi:DHH family phosphoesterase [Archaeoglobus profundus]|uniref:Phosphoesterase RecJ domain protein n=1 Tax=Archaeoglobus profundus (strain DSM 5631 / JCM 9629 / NBRC 100127 / Av18) TaxID=572546 RepID=D2RHW0_ARCPA|nr:DHH family phosphoesterase [Archaeoglobus profundus]ADB57885.1 phosphoesterase RecJ domain protein [Archaeoglobus profundus DSM 5631]